MTIRVTCAECGSVLKIKDELAGTDGRCPKCKTPFAVPAAPVATSDPVERTAPERAEKSHAKPAQKASPKPVESPVAESRPADSKPVESTSTGHKSVDKRPVEGKPAAAVAESKPAPANPGSAKAGSTKASGDDDFDPLDFLMSGGPITAPPPPPPAAAPSGPSWRKPAPPPDDADAAARPKSPAGSNSAAASANAMLSASANAKELLSKSMEDSRVRAAQMPEEVQEPRFDFAGFFREIGLKGLGGVAGIVVVALGVYLLFDRMMGGGLKLPPLAEVEGKVTLDGKPVAGAMVNFAPVEPAIADSTRERARTSIGITDAEGFFTMAYLLDENGEPDIEGVTVGKCRVWISQLGGTIPRQYSEASMLVKEVAPGSQVIDFEMKSK